MNLANFIFYVLLFIGFFLPTNSNMYLPLPGMLLKVNELAFLLLPIVNYFCSSNEKKLVINRKLSVYILLYLGIVVITEFLFKPLIFGQSFGDSFKSFRIGLPFFSSMMLLYSGINANIRIVWKVLLYAVGISVILSILSVFINLPIYYNKEESDDILQITQGRIINANSSFGIIGLYLLYQDKNKWYNKGKLVKYVSILSIIILVLSFNRTYLALLLFEFLFIARKSMSIKTFSKILLYPSLLLLSTFLLYNNNEYVKKQVDNRVFSIVFEDNSIKESAIDGNRDMIYKGALGKIDDGYWFIGLPYNTPIYINTSIFLKEPTPMNVTDTSLLNVLLRYGIIPLILFCLIYRRIFKIFKSYNLVIVLIIFTLASLNIDSLFRHNSVFFIIIIISLLSLKPYEKNNIYSQNQLR